MKSKIVRLLLPWSLLGLLPGFAGIGRAQVVGTLVVVRNDVRAAAPGAALTRVRPLDEIAAGTTLVTGKDSFAELTLEPQDAAEPETSVQLGSESRVVVGETGLEEVEGKVLFAFYRQARADVAVKTSTAVLDNLSASTFLGISAAGAGGTTVSVFEGPILVRSVSGGPALELGTGYRTVVVEGRGPTPPTPIDPSDWTLSAAAGGPPFEPPQETTEPPVVIETPDRTIRGEFEKP